MTGGHTILLENKEAVKVLYRASGTQQLRTKKELSELTRRWHT